MSAIFNNFTAPEWPAEYPDQFRQLVWGLYHQNEAPAKEDEAINHATAESLWTLCRFADRDPEEMIWQVRGIIPVTADIPLLMQLYGSCLEFVEDSIDPGHPSYQLALMAAVAATLQVRERSLEGTLYPAT